MNARLSKPINRDSFLSIVDKWLKRHEAATNTIEGDTTWSSITTSDGSAATTK